MHAINFKRPDTLTKQDCKWFCHTAHILYQACSTLKISPFHGTHINVISSTHTQTSSFPSASFHETCTFSTALHVDLSHQILPHKTTYVENMDRSSFTCFSLH